MFVVAADSDPDEFFFQNQENEDIRMLSEVLRFVDYEDQW